MRARPSANASAEGLAPVVAHTVPALSRNHDALVALLTIAGNTSPIAVGDRRARPTHGTDQQTGGNQAADRHGPESRPAHWCPNS